MATSGQGHVLGAAVLGAVVRLWKMGPMLAMEGVES